METQASSCKYNPFPINWTAPKIMGIKISLVKFSVLSIHPTCRFITESRKYLNYSVNFSFLSKVTTCLNAPSTDILFLIITNS